MKKNIIKLITCAFLIMFFIPMHGAAPLARLGTNPGVRQAGMKAVQKASDQMPALVTGVRHGSTPHPTGSWKKPPPSKEQLQKIIADRKEAEARFNETLNAPTPKKVNIGPDIPQLEPRSSFIPRQEPSSETEFLEPAESEQKAPALKSPFLEGQPLLEALQNSPTLLNLSAPHLYDEAMKNVGRAIKNTLSNGFSIFLVPADTATFLQPTGLIPQNTTEWMQKKIEGEVYTAAMKLQNGNIVALVRSADPYIVLVKPAPEKSALGYFGFSNPYQQPKTTTEQYLSSFDLPPHVKIPEWTTEQTHQENFLEKIDQGYEKTKEIAQEKAQKKLAAEIAELAAEEEQLKANLAKIAEEKRLEVEKKEKDLAEQQAKERARVEREQITLRAQEAERIRSEQEKQLAEQQEKERAELQRQETERIAQAKRMQLEQEQLEAERIAKEQRIEAERVRIEEENRLAEQQEKERDDQQTIDDLLQDFNAELEQQSAKELKKFEEQLLAEEKEIDAKIEADREKIKKQFAKEQEKIEAQAKQQLEAIDKSLKQRMIHAKETLEKDQTFIKLDAEKQEKIIEKIEKKESQKFEGVRKSIVERRDNQLTKAKEKLSQEIQKLEAEHQQATEKAKADSAARAQQLEQTSTEALTAKRDALEAEKQEAKAQEEFENAQLKADQAKLQADKDAQAKQRLEEVQKNLETAQKNKLEAELEAANKRAALELAEKKEAEVKKTTEAAQKAVDLKKLEQEELAKQLQVLEQEAKNLEKDLAQEKQLAENLKEQERLKDKEAKKLAELEELKTKQMQEFVKQEKALAEKEAAEDALKKELDELAKEEAKLEEIGQKKLAEKEREKNEKEKKAIKRELELPGGDGKLPEEKVKTPPLLPIEIPSMPQPEEKQTPTPPERIPSLQELPERESSFAEASNFAKDSADITADKQGQTPNLPEQIPSLPQMPQQAESESIEKVEVVPSIEKEKEVTQNYTPKPLQQPRIKPAQLTEVKTEAVIPTSSGEPEQLHGTQFPIFGFPKIKTAPPHKPIIPQGTSVTPSTPTSSYSGVPTSSSSGDWPTTSYEQLSMQPEKKSEPAPQAKPKAPKLSRKAQEFFEKYLAKKEPVVAERETTESKGTGGFLKGLRLLQRKHQVAVKKPVTPSETPPEGPKEPTPVLSFVKRVTTTIANVINNVIDTIGSYINRLLTPNKPT